MKKLMLLFAVSFVGMSGQDTWLGLKFGMTNAQVKEVLLKKGFELTDDAQTQRVAPYVVSPDFELKLPELTMHLYFRVRVGFNASGLERVVLTIDKERQVAADPSTKLSTLAAVAATALYDTLVGKYGTPSKESGRCEDTSARFFLQGLDAGCSALWKAEGQSVSFYWSYHFGSIQSENSVHMITYRAVTSSL